MARERWVFDISLEGDVEIYSIKNLLRRAEQYFQNGDYDSCYAFLMRAESSQQGKLALARFFMTLGTTDLPQEKKLREAEKLLLEIVEDTPESRMDLSRLYLQLKRPLAALGWRLRSREKLEDAECEMFKRKILQLEVSSLHNCPMDLYTLGMVLSDHKETYRQAKRLLQLACEYENNPCIKGVAALRIAEISDDPNEQSQYFRLAEAWGNPELLRRKG